jgi:acyl-CoA reductase-like NAD-dependent aldehyde dehydrogenase
MRTATAGLKGAPVRASLCSGLMGSCGLSEAAAGGSIQASWAATPLADRLHVVRRARQTMACRAEDFAAAISSALVRTKTDTLLAELLPLLDACKFLEREGRQLLAPRRLGSSGRPLWFSGVVAEIHREPVGHVLVIGPSNFPLFLPGVQTMQALVAGNTVTWKPGVGGEAVARLVADVLHDAGLPMGVLTVTDESVEAARSAIAGGPDKVIFTGSSASGQSVLAELAGTSTSAVVELSGADAVVVTPSADLAKVAKAVAFGLRLNGGAVCMSPRRLFAERGTMARLRPLLEAELAKVPAVALDVKTSAVLRELLNEAVNAGANLRGAFEPEAQLPLLVEHASVGMSIARSDFFAPVLSLIEVASMLQVPELYAQCPYGLGVSIFCDARNEKEARVLARLLKAGTVLINDVIAPTADPRVPFGGRGASGYGVTRGAEGLLEMTAVKTLLVRRGGSMRHLDPTRDQDTAMFAGLIGVVHGEGLAARWNALKQVMKSSRR